MTSIVVANWTTSPENVTITSTQHPHTLEGKWQYYTSLNFFTISSIMKSEGNYLDCFMAMSTSRAPCCHETLCVYTQTFSVDRGTVFIYLLSRNIKKALVIKYNSYFVLIIKINNDQKVTPLKSGRVITLKKISFENLYFLVTNVFSVSKGISWYLDISSVDLAARFKTGMYLLNREKRSFSEINSFK